MRATLQINNDSSPLIKINFSHKTLEWLAEHDIVSSFSTVKTERLNRINIGMIGVSVSQNGSTALIHDYRTLFHGESILESIYHSFELTQEQYFELLIGKNISEITKNDTLVELSKDDSNGGGSKITMYKRGYLKDYQIPGMNPY